MLNSIHFFPIGLLKCICYLSPIHILTQISDPKNILKSFELRIVFLTADLNVSQLLEQKGKISFVSRLLYFFFEKKFYPRLHLHTEGPYPPRPQLGLSF